MAETNPDRTALVTGASSGIGLAITRMLGEEGHRVSMVARNRDKLEAAAALVASEGCEVEPIQADLTDETSIADLVAEHGRRWGRMDVLVNNAGIAAPSDIGSQPSASLEEHLAVNLRSIVLLYRESLPLLEAAAGEGGALVVNTASVVGKSGQAYLGVYSATKHAVIGFTESMNRELGRRGIRSTALCPAWVDTPMSEVVKNRIPADEMLRPDDVAEMARALLRLSPGVGVPEIVIGRPEHGYELVLPTREAA